MALVKPSRKEATYLFHGQSSCLEGQRLGEREKFLNMNGSHTLTGSKQTLSYFQIYKKLGK